VQLNNLSSEMQNGFHKDFREITKLLGSEKLKKIPNSIETLIDLWTETDQNVRVTDLLDCVQKIGRFDVCENINKVLGL
jgi:hypothetical protein